jgi:hypothetical protein
MPPRRPSWLRAVVLSLVVLAAGSLLGAVWYHLERSASIQPPSVERTADGWHVTARHQREFSGLALSGDRLLWQNGASVEDPRPRLGPPPPPRPRPGHAHHMGPGGGRRWTLAEVGSVRSYPAISGDVAVWCSALAIGAPTINGARVGSGEAFEVAEGTASRSSPAASSCGQRAGPAEDQPIALKPPDPVVGG